MIWLFWFSVAFLVYALAGYALLLRILSIWRSRPHRRGTIWPTVSVIIPAHNEAHLLRSKITNTLELAYPEDKREIIVASDASEDETDDIVRSFAPYGVKLVQIPERRGKHHAQMIARDASHGEILFFTDASVHLEPCALEKMVSNFADPSVGCVSSEDQVIRERKVWRGEQLYVGFEMRLRQLEAQVGSLVGASGSCFAARREVCSVWHPEQSSDFFVPLHAATCGMRTVVDPECRGQYSVLPSAKAELHRKVRTIVHGLNVFFNHRALLNPFRYGFVSWQLVSHKLFRWLMPFAILSLLISNLFLWKAGAFYRISLILQVALYGTGLLALGTAHLKRFEVFRLAGFFLMGNAATIIAWLKFCSGEKFVTWQPSRRT